MIKPPEKATKIPEKIKTAAVTDRNWKYKIRNMSINEMGITINSRFVARI